MKENQNTEWKRSWRDSYLKWLCGFANAEGGVLVIGRNDEGVAIGAKDAGKLMVEIPNKVRDILGIMVDVKRTATTWSKFGSTRIPAQSTTKANTTIAAAAPIRC